MLDKLNSTESRAVEPTDAAVRVAVLAWRRSGQTEQDLDDLVAYPTTLD